MEVAAKPAGPPPFHLKPTHQPMLWAALAYSLGIVAGTYLWRPALWWVVAGASFMAAGLFFVRRRAWFAGALALGAVFLAGALHIQLRGKSAHVDTTILEYADGQGLQIVAHVTRDGRLRVRFFGEAQAPAELPQSRAFDYQGYLAANGIAALASARAENVGLLPGFVGNQIERWRASIAV